jgi:aryl-alcohol dehydrogenase-like predicted oxidoreductase
MTIEDIRGRIDRLGELSRGLARERVLWEEAQDPLLYLEWKASLHALENALPRYECLQPLYNLYDRAPFEEALEPLCVKEGLGVITYFSLAAGFLTGKYRSEGDLSQSPRGAKVKDYLNGHGRRILGALDDVAARCRSTPARVALAWLLARPGVTAPIVSATSLEQFHDLVEATKLELDAGAVEQLSQASA